MKAGELTNVHFDEDSLRTLTKRELLTSRFTGKTFDFDWWFGSAFVASMAVCPFGFLYLGQYRSAIMIFPWSALLIATWTFVWINKRRLQTMRVEIDWRHRRIQFRNFRFSSRWLPEKPRAHENVDSSDLLSSRWEFFRKIRGLELRTTKGRVTIPSQMEYFAEIGAAISQIIDENFADAKWVRSARDREPNIRTPVYVWILIVVAALAAVTFLLW